MTRKRTAFGVMMFPTDDAMGVPQLAAAAEARGFESLFLPEHTHIPVSRQSPYPGGGELPREYLRTFDPLIALSAAASVTETIKLGTGIALVTERDPILMAKQVASLDRLSGGRVLLGIGAGWNAEEMANHGVVYADRWKVLRERVLAMQAIWREEQAEFHGDFVDFDPIWSWPKPREASGPPILLGASSRYAFARIAEYAQGWMPIAPRPGRVGVDLREGMAALEREVTARGRDFATIDCSVFGVGPDAEQIRELEDIGFGRIIFGLPPSGPDRIIPLLDRYADLAASLA